MKGKTNEVDPAKGIDLIDEINHSGLSSLKFKKR